MNVIFICKWMAKRQKRLSEYYKGYKERSWLPHNQAFHIIKSLYVKSLYILYIQKGEKYAYHEFSQLFRRPVSYWPGWIWSVSVAKVRKGLRVWCQLISPIQYTDFDNHSTYFRFGKHSRHILHRILCAFYNHCNGLECIHLTVHKYLKELIGGGFYQHMISDIFTCIKSIWKKK